MRATGGLTVRHGSCWTMSVRACHSMPATMCWGSSAVAAKTDQVRPTRTNATMTMTVIAATRIAFSARRQSITTDHLEQLDAAATRVPGNRPERNRPRRRVARAKRVQHSLPVEHVADSLAAHVLVQLLLA